MLCWLVMLSCTGTPTERPTLPPAEPPPAAPEPPDPGGLEALKGRRVWMVNAPEGACAQAESLGLVVQCEPSRPGAARGEVVAWCPEIPHSSLEALAKALSQEGFRVRSWQLQPEEADPEECGQFYEITVRY